MGSTLHELSGFGGEELVKCGEIVLSSKQNAFAFTCIHCNQMFWQIVVFARHVRLEHQLEDEVIELYKKELQDLSVYTVEELLCDEDETGLLNENTTTKEQVTVDAVNSPIPYSDDTGIDSDEELEKEISELLASIATSDSNSVNESVYSEDSGLDSKNISDQDRYELNMKDQSKIKGKQESKVADKRIPSTITAIHSGSKVDFASVNKNITNVTHNNLKLQEQKQVQKLETNLQNQKAADNLEHKNKVKPKPTNISDSQTKYENHTKKSLDVTSKKVKLVVQLKDSKFEELHELGCINSASCEELKAPEINLKDDLVSTGNTKCGELHKELEIDLIDELLSIDHAKSEELCKELKSDLNTELVSTDGTKCEEFHKELEIDFLKDDLVSIDDTKCRKLLKELEIDFNDELRSINDAKCEELHKELEINSNDDLECVREVEETNVSDIGLSDARDLENDTQTAFEQTDKPFIIVGVDDELAGIKFSEKEIDEIKTGISEVPVYDFKQLENIELENAVTHGLSAYQMEYLVYNVTNSKSSLKESATSHDNKCITKATDLAGPLDLSLNKSGELADMQSEEIPDILHNDNDQRKIKRDILTEVESLLAQETTFIDISTPSFESNELLTYDSMDSHQLPPFSKFFKNTANSLINSNGFLAQSTPKQKPLNISKETKQTKIASPLRPSAQLNMNAKDATNSSENDENVKHASENRASKKSIKFPILKRQLQNIEKVNELKRMKIDSEARKKNIQSEDCVKKQGLEILSVEVLPPNATIADKTKVEELKNLKLPSIKQVINHVVKWEPTPTENIEEDLIPYVKIKKPSAYSSHVAADSTSEKCMTSMSELNYTPEDTLNQLKLEHFIDEKPLFNSLLQNSLNFADPLNSDRRMESLIEENSFANESIISQASEEEKENYLLLRPLGLRIIFDPDVEEGMKLKDLETIRAKASLFAKIYAEFKYLWKVGKGVKSFEKLELDFNKLMQRINEHYKLELTITETKRIVNLISLWHMQTYNKWFIKKKPALESVYHYLQLFTYLPKTARRIFYCEECPRYFLSQQKYFAHRDKHIGMPPTCPYCQTTYASRKELQLHTKVCITFTCMECDCKFENAADLEYHLRNEHLWQCETCGRLCATALDLEWHEHQYPIICGLCNHLFDSAGELQKHRQNSFHWDYICQKCEVFLPTATQMKHHLMLCGSGCKIGDNS